MNKKIMGQADEVALKEPTVSESKMPSLEFFDPYQLLRTADDLFASASGHLNHPEADLQQEVHFVRVTIKRVRAVLLLLRPGLGLRAFKSRNALLRSTAKLLATARESDVTRQCLVALSEAASDQEDREALASVLKGFEQSAGEEPAEVAAMIGKAGLALEKNRRSVNGLRFVRGAGKMVAKGLREVYREGRKRMKCAAKREDSESLHRWRIRVKNLYHALKILGIPSHDLAKVVRRLGKLQETLGQEHDLADIHARITQDPALFGGAPAVKRVRKLLESRSKELRQAALRLGSKVYKKKADDFLAAWEKSTGY
jgi:CHAD domain-containing protein